MPCHFNFQGNLPWARSDDQGIHERSHGHWSQVAGRVCPEIFPLQRPHETQQAEETAEDRAFIQQIRGSKLMENLASFQEISHKSYLLRISLCYFFSECFTCIYTCRYVYISKEFLLWYKWWSMNRVQVRVTYVYNHEYNYACIIMRLDQS